MLPTLCGSDTFSFLFRSIYQVNTNVLDCTIGPMFTNTLKRVIRSIESFVVFFVCTKDSYLLLCNARNISSMH